jgi:hypothetical protein
MSSDFTIDGMVFPYRPRYQAGHRLTEGEAIALDQTRKENIRNAYSLKSKRMRELGVTEAEIFQSGLEFINNYQFSVIPRKRQSNDKIGIIAREVATELVKLRIQHLDQKPAIGAIEAMIASEITNNPFVLQEAKRRYDRLLSLASQVIEANYAE